MRKKESYCFRQIIHTNNGHLPTKVIPLIESKDEPVIQCGVPVLTVENTFVGDCG